LVTGLAEELSFTVDVPCAWVQFDDVTMTSYRKLCKAIV